MAKGLPPREATIKALEEITGPVIAITLVLSSVFIPTGVHRRHQRPVLSAVRAHDRGVDDHLGDQRHDDGARARRHASSSRTSHGEERREALPRSGVVLLVRAARRLLPHGPRAGLFGLSAGGHGHEAHGSPAALWTDPPRRRRRAARFSATAMNERRRTARCFAFFKVFNALLRLADERLRPHRRASSCARPIMLLAATAAHGAHVARLPHGAGRLHPGAGQGLPRRERACFPTARASSAPRR